MQSSNNRSRQNAFDTLAMILFCRKAGTYKKLRKKTTRNFKRVIYRHVKCGLSKSNET